VLERGYALVYGPDGKLLRSTANVMAYDNIVARLADGSLRARVTSKE
jgi:exodeoxyribonuclease VII large subunit